jgi:hypothetical protein
MLDANLHEVTINALAGIEELNLVRQALQAELISNLENLGGSVIITPTMEAGVMGQLLSRIEDGRQKNEVEDQIRAS